MLSSFYYNYHRRIYQHITMSLLGIFMSRIACLGMMILPVFLWHVGERFAVLTSSVLNQGASKTANVFIPGNHNLQSTSYLVAARDERIQDCLRLGNCKD